MARSRSEIGIDGATGRGAVTDSPLPL